MMNLPMTLLKAPTGIDGLDGITKGGLPRARPTLVCGQTGTGKTLLAFEFLVNGAALYAEAGVFISFEESPEELVQNVASFGFAVDQLIEKNLLIIDYIRLERTQVNGSYDLDGLFIRLDQALSKVNAKRIVLDSMDMLFSALPNQGIIREEIRRLLLWLKEKDLTVIITGESGEKSLTRDGMEEYVSDCVILLENRIFNQTTTRLLRIVKYRGSEHGSNEYPFLIDQHGILVLPVTALSLDMLVSNERVSTGIARLDTMLDNQGYYRGSTIMVTGTPGSGKSSLAVSFAVAACKRGESCQYFLLEESGRQIVRNMRSIGIDLQPWLDQGLLRFEMTRPTLYGLEMHLARFHQAIVSFKPSIVIFDPLSSLSNIEDPNALKLMLLRLANFLKSRNITAHFVSLRSTDDAMHTAETGISSIIDSWIQLQDVEMNGERNRIIQILKSRGMPHSNQMREFTLSEDGIQICDVYLGASGILTGSARIAQEARDAAKMQADQLINQGRTRELESQRALKNAQIAAIEAEFALSQTEIMRQIEVDKVNVDELQIICRKMSLSRQADVPYGTATSGDENA